MKSKILFILTFLFIISFKSNGQDTQESDFMGGITSFINWISDIDKVINSIGEKEKLQKLNRKLGYIILDLGNIKDGKYFLAREIAKIENLNDHTEISSLKSQTDQLKNDIEEFISNLNEIKGLINQTDQTHLDSIINEIRAGFKYQKLDYLKDLTDYLYKKNMDYGKIKEESEEAKLIVEEAYNKIMSAQQKIIKRMDN